MLNVAGNAEVQPVRIGETLYKSLGVVVSYKPRPLFFNLPHLTIIKMDKYLRGKEVQTVVFSDGTESKISHQLKNRIGQMYWYYVQFPCGNWREFDIRCYINESEIPSNCILTKKSLPFLSNLLSKKTWVEFTDR